MWTADGLQGPRVCESLSGRVRLCWREEQLEGQCCVLAAGSQRAGAGTLGIWDAGTLGAKGRGWKGGRATLGEAVEGQPTSRESSMPYREDLRHPDEDVGRERGGGSAGRTAERAAKKEGIAKEVRAPDLPRPPVSPSTSPQERQPAARSPLLAPQPAPGVGPSQASRCP